MKYDSIFGPYCSNSESFGYNYKYNTSLQDACAIPGAIHSPNQARPIIPVIWTRLYQDVWHHYCSKCVICLLDTETL